MRIKKIKYSVDDLATVIIVLYFFSFLLNQILGASLNIVTFVVGISGFLFLINYKKLDINIENIKIIIWFSLLVIFMIISMIYTNNISATSLIINLQYIGIAILLIRYRLNSKIILLSFYFHCIYFLFHIIIGTLSNEILTASRNMISVIMLIQSTLVYMAIYKNKKILSYLPALLTFIISFWAVGRSGIIASGIMLLGLFICTLKRENLKRNIALSIVLVFFVTLLLSSAIDVERITSSIFNSYDIVYERALTAGLESEGRDTIVKEYIEGIQANDLSLLLGLPFIGQSVFDDFNNNLHNSFLQAHAYFGLAGLFMITLNILIVAIVNFRLRNFLYLFLFLSLLLRIFTDTVAFVGIMDPLLYYFMIGTILKTLDKSKYNWRNKLV